MSKKNLFDTEAKRKLKELAESIDYTMFISGLKMQPSHTIPMSTKEVDDQGNIWFLSNRNSVHNTNIEKDKNVHLVYADNSDYQFLSVYGAASISTDRNRIKDLYGSGDDAWFDGVDDPNITAISIRPVEVNYWDTKNGKVISLLKQAAGAITGDEPDLGVEGKLEI